MKTKRRKRASRLSRRTYKRNPTKSVADPHGARELALCYDNERANQIQKESIINNLARKLAKGQYKKDMAAKLWGYAAKSGADAYAKTFGSHGDTGSKMFNAATREMAAKILEEENFEYVKERSEQFAPKPKHRRNPAPSRERRAEKLDRMRKSAYSRYQATEDTRHERAYSRLTDMMYRAKEGDRNWYKGRPAYRHGAKPTVSTIKSIVQANGSHYFDKAAMKFFGNTMADFKVFRSKKSGRIFIGAPSRVQKGYYSLHEFNGKRLVSVHGTPNYWSSVPDWVDKQ